MADRRKQQQAWLDERGVTFGAVSAWAREQGLQSRGSLLSKDAKAAWDEHHPDAPL